MTEVDASRSCPTCRTAWRLPLFLALVLAAILLSQQRGIRNSVFKPLGGPRSTTPGDGQRPASNRVFLTVNTNDGRPLQSVTADWQPAMTALNLLQQEPRVSFQCQGAGPAAFVTELNGQENEGADGRNWTYSINGQPAKESCGVCELRPNDHVLWTFARPQ